MSGCVRHIEDGICDLNCPQRSNCHDFRGWRLPDGRRMILHTRTVVPRLDDGGIGDPNVDYAITVEGDDRYGKYTVIIPINMLRR